MLPSQIKIGAAFWTVTVTDDLGDRDGGCDPNLNRFLVSADLCPAQQRRALVHEMFHAAIDFVRPMSEEEKFTEEEWIRRVEGVWDSILAENGMWPW